jgi:hypothetical protein
MRVRGADMYREVLEGPIRTFTHTIGADWYHGDSHRDLGSREKAKKIEGHDI